MSLRDQIFNVVQAVQLVIKAPQPYGLELFSHNSSCKIKGNESACGLQLRSTVCSADSVFSCLILIYGSTENVVVGDSKQHGSTEMKFNGLSNTVQSKICRATVLIRSFLQYFNSLNETWNYDTVVFSFLQYQN